MYAKLLDEISPSALLDRLKSMTVTDAVTTYGVVKTRRSRCFVYQSIDSSVWTAVIPLAVEAGIKIRGVLTLRAYLLSGIVQSGQSRNLLSFLHLPGCVDRYVLLDPHGGVVYGRVDSENSENTAIETVLRERCFAEKHEVVIQRYASSPVDKTESGTRHFAAVIFQKAMKPFRTISFPSEKSGSSKTVAAVLVAMNSMRLLTWVLAAAFVVSTLTAVIATGISRTEDPAVSSYQESYSQSVILARELDSLQSVLSSETSADGVRSPAASVFSLFCQSSIRGLFLRRVAVTRATDTFLVEVEGLSTTESAVFRYYETIGDLASPLPVALKAISQEIIRQRNQTDTLLSFGLSIVVDESDY